MPRMLYLTPPQSDDFPLQQSLGQASARSFFYLQVKRQSMS